MLKILTKKNNLILIIFTIFLVVFVFSIYSSYITKTPLIQESLKPLKLKPVPKSTTNMFKNIGKAYANVFTLGLASLAWQDNGKGSSAPPPRPPPPDQPRLMDGYRYGGCWKVALGSNLTQEDGAYTMERCVQTAKTNQRNVAILNGDVCKTGNFQDADMSLLEGKEKTDPDCNINKTENNASMIYSSYVAPPPESIYGYTYKGCWTATGDPATNPLPVHIPGEYTMNTCVYEAIKQGYKTVALQNGNQCWAGNKTDYFKDNYKSIGPADTTGDPYACDISGPGPNTAIVYSIINEPVIPNLGGYRYGGCWKDQDSSPSLPNSIGEGGLSLEDCIASASLYGYNSIAYKKGGKCYTANQGIDGVDYKKGGEIANNNRSCDVGGPGPNTSIIYTTYGALHEPTIKGFDYKGCWKENSQDPAITYNVGSGFTMDSCLKAAKNGKFDTAALLNQNECALGIQGVNGSDYKKYGEISDPNSSLCNSEYPAENTAVVYSTWTPTDTSSPVIDKVKDVIGIGTGIDINPPANVGDFMFRGYWNESADKCVNQYLGTYSLDDCVSNANSMGYNTVSFQNKNQCWAGKSPDYKKYGKPTANTIKNPNTTVAAIYSTSAEPSTHVSCGIHKEGIDTMESTTTTTTSTTPQPQPQPAYTTPQTTTITFDPIPKTNTIITYSQTPISTSANSPFKKSSDMTQKEKSDVHRKWLPNTPFVYENKNGESKPTSTTPTSNSSLASTRFSNFDIINNRYGSATNNGNTGLELFTLLNSKEGIDSLSPPSSEIPGPFVPKSTVVPPVCPSIPPVIIKTDCSVCNKNKEASSSSSSSTSASNLTSQMSSNFANTNSPSSASSVSSSYGTSTGNPYSTMSAFDNTKPMNASCNSQGRSYDNIPQPYLPSFSGFGM